MLLYYQKTARFNKNILETYKNKGYKMKTLFVVVFLMLVVGLFKNLNNITQNDIILNEEVHLIFSQLRNKS